MCIVCLDEQNMYFVYAEHIHITVVNKSEFIDITKQYGRNFQLVAHKHQFAYTIQRNGA